MAKMRALIVGVFLVFALYFVNMGFNFFSVPEFISNYDKWIFVVCGVLLIFGAVNYIKASKNAV